jgi:hypothetical protein
MYTTFTINNGEFMNFKKTSILIVILLACSLIRAELRINTVAQRFYSEGASSKVDQNEYHILAFQVFNLFQINPNTSDESVFAHLRVIGTPAALRLIEDLKKLVKTVKNDAKILKG